MTGLAERRVPAKVDVMTAIRTRRSIRKYTGEPLDEQSLRAILDAGFCAPSASNRRPWHFMVVRDSALLESIAGAHPYAKMMPAAGCCIIVCGDQTIQGRIGLLVEDCSAAIQNMLLAAHGLGLGAVWCGLYIGEDLRPAPPEGPQAARPGITRELSVEFAELLGLPSDIVPVGMIAVGHADESKAGTDRFDESRVHYESWSAPK